VVRSSDFSSTTREGFRNYTYIFPEKKAAIVIAGSILSEGIDDIYFKMVNFILDGKNKTINAFSYLCLIKPEKRL
jgi:hypothetical protein